MGTRLLKAAKAEKGDDDQYFCVSDDAGEKDWLSDIPAVGSAPADSMGYTELCIAHMRRTLESDTTLHAMTGYDCKEFGTLYRAFVAAWEVAEAEELERRRRYREGRKGKRGPRPAADVYEDHVRNVPPMRDDPIRASEPGNRCTLHPVYVLMLDLVRKYRNNCQDQLAAMFGIDQATVCKHIRRADRILATMLPTPHRFMDILRNVGSKEEFDKLFPEGAAVDTILVDGTHVRFTRAKDGDVRDAMYSGKKKAYTGNTVLMTMPDGMVIAISRTREGSAHDITITRELVGDLGAFATGVLGAPSKDAPGADPPKNTRRMALRVLADAGFKGLDRDLPGAEVVTPAKRPPRGELTGEQREHNRRLSRERMRVENAVAAVKHYRRVSSVYEGTLEGFNAEFNVACGLANARLMLRNGTYGHWQSVLDGGKGR